MKLNRQELPTQHPLLLFIVINISPLLILFLGIELLAIISSLFNTHFSLTKIFIPILTLAIILTPIIPGLALCHIVSRNLKLKLLKICLLTLLWLFIATGFATFLGHVLQYGAVADFGQDPEILEKPIYLPMNFFKLAVPICAIWSTVVTILFEYPSHKTKTQAAF